MKGSLRWMLLLVATLLLCQPAMAEDNLATKKQQRLLQLSGQITKLETRTFTLRQRIRRISGTIFGGKFKTSAPRLRINIKNLTAGVLQVETLTVRLNNQVIYQGSKGKDKWVQSGATLFNKNVSTRRHTLTVEMNIRGRSFGPITYLRKSKMQISNFTRFQAVKGRDINISIKLADKGGAKFEKRPEIRFNQS